MVLGQRKAQAEGVPDGVKKGQWRDSAELVCFSVLLLLFLKTFVCQQFVIPSASMRNTLMIGDHVLTNKFLYAVPQFAWEKALFPLRSVERGDIMAFRYPLNRELDFVKRCVAVPGDRVAIQNKRLYVNDKLITGAFEHHILKEGQQPQSGPWPLDRDAGYTMVDWVKTVGGEDARFCPPPWPFTDPAVLHGNRQGMASDDSNCFFFRDDIPAFVVPPGHVMGMGDNRDNSRDSRAWGLIPIDHLRGKPFLVWWSYREGGNDDQNAVESRGPGDVLRNYWDGLLHFFTRTRWSRTGYFPR